MAAIMLLALAGCGGSSASSAPSAPAGGTPAAPSSSAPGANDAPATVRIGTGPSGGIHYATFSGIASLIERDHPNYTVSAEISTGTTENFNNIFSGNIDLGLVMADCIDDAYNATGSYAGNEPGQFVHVMSGYAPHIHVFVRADSNIHTFQDLVGKRAATGVGVMADDLEMILEEYGLGGTLASSQGMSLSDMCNALADGNVDVCCYISDFPSGSIADLALTTGIRFLEIDEDVAQKICADTEVYFVSEIDASYYEGIEENVRTIATRTQMVARPDLDEEIVYNVIKSIVEHGDELGNFHSRAPLWNLDNALDLVNIPLHPGAERYYREAGLIQ